MIFSDATQVFGAISVISGIIGGALFIKAKVAENTKTLTDHVSADSVFHSSMIDRLARIETKIDALLPNREGA